MSKLSQDDWDNIFSVLVEHVQRNYVLRELLGLVSKSFNRTVHELVDHPLSLFMCTPLNLRVQIGFFDDNQAQDNVEYLVGPLSLLPGGEITTEVAEKQIRKNWFGRDSYGTERSYESVIMQGIYPGCIWGSDRILQGGYSFGNNTVTFYRNPENKLICIHDTRATDKHSISCGYSNKYWLYVLEVDGYYFTSYVYVILPYFDDRIKVYGGHDVVAVYDISCLEVETLIKDPDVSALPHGKCPFHS